MFYTNSVFLFTIYLFGNFLFDPTYGNIADIDEVRNSKSFADRQIICENSLGSNNVCTLLNTGCYCIVQQQVPWSQALQFCATNGKSLLSINTLNKRSDLKANLPQIVNSLGTNNIVTRVGLWTSGTFSDGVFTWASTGEVFTSAQWQFGSPKNVAGPSDCVRLIPSDGTGTCDLADLDCGQWLPFICE